MEAAKGCAFFFEWKEICAPRRHTENGDTGMGPPPGAQKAGRGCGEKRRRRLSGPLSAPSRCRSGTMTGRGIAFTAFFCHAVGGRGFHGQSGNRIDSAQYGAAAGIRHRVRRMDGAVRSLSGTDAVLRPDPGDQASFTIEISGFRLFPVVLYLQAGTGDDVFPRCAFQLSIGGNPQSFCVPIECPHRGIWQMQLRRLKVRDLFGFFSLPLLDFFFFRHREELHTLAVYPRLHASGSIRTRLPKDTAYSEDHLIPADTGDSSAGCALPAGGFPQTDSLENHGQNARAVFQTIRDTGGALCSGAFGSCLDGPAGEILWTAVIYCASAQAKSCFIML